MLHQIKPCPVCQQAYGWFERRLQSYRQYFHADGQASHATDGDGNGRGGKRKYCYECGHILTGCVVETDTPAQDYCDACIYLKPSEREQDEEYLLTKKRSPHWCSKHSIVISHQGQHPRLPKPDYCDGPFEAK